MTRRSRKAEEETTLSELEVLVELQELDIRLSQLAHRSLTLPERDQLEALREQDSKLQSELDEIADELNALRQSQNDREVEIQHLEDKVARATSSLYGDDMTSPKDATVLQSEIDSLSGRQSLLEDQIIEIMEQIEPFSNEESRIESARHDCRSQMTALEEQIAAHINEIDSERESVVIEKRNVEERAGVELNSTQRTGNGWETT